MRVRPFPSPVSTRFRLRKWHPAPLALFCLLGACSPMGTRREEVAQSGPDKQQVLTPDFMNDPLEPVNRGMWAVNRGLLVGVMQPTGRVYRTVVPRPARESINHFSRNLTYPGRVVNHMLQGRWQGAGDESLRFLTNTTVGVGGFFDVASRWNMPKSDADFGQTFSRWGWTPHTYLMLPFVGPSDDSHAFGWAADEAAQPWNYYETFRQISYGTTYNRLVENTDEADRFMRSEADPYAVVKYAWSYASKEKEPEWRTKGAIDPATMETMGVVNIACKDPGFRHQGHEMGVRIPATGRNMKFNCWMQPQAAPVVYIVPGLSSHRVSLMTLAFAEHLYQNGYSVVATTGIFHPEFMENASTADLPAYPPVDCHDLLVEMTEIDRLLERKNPGLLGRRAFVGFSMGGFQALHMAANEKKQGAGLMTFDRYLAINPPVNLHHGVERIDGFNNAAMAWPANERQFLADNALHKATKLLTMPPSPANTALPFDGTESEFLIGLSFQLTLRDAIFSSQLRHNMGVIQTPLSKWRREPAYQEILGYSFRDYFVKLVLPYYKTKGVGLADFKREGNLMSYGNQLRGQKKVRVLTNRNDFLLEPDDIAWLRTTFGSSRLTMFPSGGHLGNLTSAPVQSAVLESLKGLK